MHLAHAQIDTSNATIDTTERFASDRLQTLLDPECPKCSNYSSKYVCKWCMMAVARHEARGAHCRRLHCPADLRRVDTNPTRAREGLSCPAVPHSHIYTCLLTQREADRCAAQLTGQGNQIKTAVVATACVT